MVDSRYIEPRTSGYRPWTLVLYIDYRPRDRSITYTYMYIRIDHVVILLEFPRILLFPL